MTEPSTSADTAASAAVSEDVTSLRERIAELEARLAERVDEVVVLHEETRVLQKERAVRDEFIRSMERDVLRLPAAERQLIETDEALTSLRAQFDAYRADSEHQIAELGHQVNAAHRRMAELDDIIVAFERRRLIVLSARLRSLVRVTPPT